MSIITGRDVVNCRRWVEKMKKEEGRRRGRRRAGGSGREQEEEMDNHQEVEFPGAHRHILDLRFMKTEGYYPWLKDRDAMSITVWLLLSFQKYFYFSNSLAKLYLLGSVEHEFVDRQSSYKNNISEDVEQRDPRYSHVSHTHSSRMSGERLWPCTNSSVSTAIEYESFRKGNSTLRDLSK